MTERKVESPTSVEVESVDVLPQVAPPTELQQYMSPAGTFNAVDALERWEHQKLVVSEIRKVALAELQPSDFVIFGGACYLQHKGAQRVQGLLGLRFPDTKPTVRRIEFPDGEFAYTVEGWVGSTTLNTSDYIVGGRSSKESFFDKFDSDGVRLPVNELDVQKAAMTNWKNRAVTGLLGLQGLTPQELKDKGFPADKIKGITFQSGGKGGGKKDVVPNFGKDFEEFWGKPWTEANKEALLWYRSVMKRNVEDESKSKWKNANQRTLDAIQTEIKTRVEAQKGEKGDD